MPRRPRAVRWRGRWLGVAAVEDEWRIDDEWWTAEEISRHYFTLTLEDGRRLTVFHDVLGGAWYAQRA